MTKQKTIRILLTGGGTGGHIFPLAAVATEINKEIMRAGYVPSVRYFGDAGNYANALLGAGVELVHITPSKWRRYFDVQNIFDIFRFIWSVIECLWKIYWFMPRVCFSKGGPGSFAVIAVCRFYTIPIVIHESDAVPGLANRVAAKYAKLIELAFLEAKSFLPSKKAYRVVGNPVREALLQKGGDNRSAKMGLGLDPDEPVVFFIGGSQGAEKFNEFILENIAELTVNFQILHQTGFKNFQSHNEQYHFMYSEHTERLTRRYKFFAFFDQNLSQAYAAADLIVARAGSGLIFEIAALGKPSILIPLPSSANDHQRENAYAYAKNGAALVVEEANLLPSIFINEAAKLLKDSLRMQSMSQAAFKFYIPDSARIIAADILSFI